MRNMEALYFVLISLLVDNAFGSAFRFSQPPVLWAAPRPQSAPQQAQRRVLFDLDPEDIMTKWGPFGYFNQYFDPANTIGPEILRGFGSPFAPYNGFQLLETITTPPLRVPEEATTTPSPYPADLFEEPGKPKEQPKASATPEPPPSTPPPSPPPPPPPAQPSYEYPPQQQRPQYPPSYPPRYPQRPAYPGQVRPTRGPHTFEEAYGGYPPMNYGQPAGNNYNNYLQYGAQPYRRSYNAHGYW